VDVLPLALPVAPMNGWLGKAGFPAGALAGASGLERSISHRILGVVEKPQIWGKIDHTQTCMSWIAPIRVERSNPAPSGPGEPGKATWAPSPPSQPFVGATGEARGRPASDYR
jgi:hypothetical protein